MIRLCKLLDLLLLTHGEHAKEENAFILKGQVVFCSVGASSLHFCHQWEPILITTAVPFRLAAVYALPSSPVNKNSAA